MSSGEHGSACMTEARKGPRFNPLGTPTTSQRCRPHPALSSLLLQGPANRFALAPLRRPSWEAKPRESAMVCYNSRPPLSFFALGCGSPAWRLNVIFLKPAASSGYSGI